MAETDRLAGQGCRKVDGETVLDNFSFGKCSADVIRNICQPVFDINRYSTQLMDADLVGLQLTNRTNFFRVGCHDTLSDIGQRNDADAKGTLLCFINAEIGYISIDTYSPLNLWSGIFG